MEPDKQIDFDKYLAWLEQQTWVLSDNGGLTFFDPDEGPREFIETAPGEWFEMEVGHDVDFTDIHDPRLIALLSAKKKELQPN
jgi:hypothetical protein